MNPRIPTRQKGFRLEMSAATLVLYVLLTVASGVVVFYLGMVTGKSMRTPEVTPPVAGQQTPTAEQAKTNGAPATPKSDLEFFKALQSETQAIEDLQAKKTQAAQETDEVVARAQREMTTEAPKPAVKAAPKPEAKPETKPEPKAPVAKAPAKPPSSAAPAAKPPEPKPTVAKAPAPKGEQFTVQVFVTRYHDKAQQLIADLKKKGFDAYLGQFQENKETLFRVRVGKGSREEADKLKARLIKDAGLKDPKVMGL